MTALATYLLFIIAAAIACSATIGIVAVIIYLRERRHDRNSTTRPERAQATVVDFPRHRTRGQVRNGMDGVA